MTTYENLSEKLENLVIFRGLLNNRIIQNIVFILNSFESDKKLSRNKYADLVCELYKSTDNLSDYILKIVIEDENLYILKKAQKIITGKYLDACIKNELSILQSISRLTSLELRTAIEAKDFLAEWENSDYNFEEIYFERLSMVSTIGYGIFAQHHIFIIKDGKITPVISPDSTSLSNLTGYDMERNSVIDNTVALLNNKPAANVLLYGDAGTGKSSTVKAIANEYWSKGLRLIELKKSQLNEIPNIVECISNNPLKFIIFIDDLSFSNDDDNFGALKAILEGSVSSKASNLIVYATSNRRHLVKEKFSDRDGDDIHFNDTREELISLSDRFGLTIIFSRQTKKLYLETVVELSKQYELKIGIDELVKKAEIYALNRAGRSPRIAKQFIEFLKSNDE